MAASKQRRRRPPLTLPAHRFDTGTPSTLNTLLRGLPSRWVAANEGFDCWSPFDLFDRFAQGKECRRKSLEELLDEFAALRP